MSIYRLLDHVSGDAPSVNLSPSSLARLLPVQHLIFEQLALISPLTALMVSRFSYRITIPILYRDVKASRELFRGLKQETEDYKRTVKALSFIRVLHLTDFASMDAVYHLEFDIGESDPETEEKCPRLYHNLFPKVEKIVYHWPAVQSDYHEYIDILESSSLDFVVGRGNRLRLQLGNRFREVEVHLEKGRTDYWMEIEEFMFFNGPKDAVIHIDVHNPTILRSIGKFMPLAWANAEKLRVVVKAEEPEFNRFSSEEEYVEPLAGSLAKYASRLREGDNPAEESQAGPFQRPKKVIFSFPNRKAVIEELFEHIIGEKEDEEAAALEEVIDEHMVFE
ncbi:hypothetical protein C360_05832 [Cryptococcus neoformans Bt15]|nr:hypothetical protein C360_05832 [Cryptococcus neoformans var. grubii Bt15]